MNTTTHHPAAARPIGRQIEMVLNHYLNPLHVYCRLVELGISRTAGLAMARWYESHIYRPVTCRAGRNENGKYLRN